MDQQSFVMDQQSFVRRARSELRASNRRLAEDLGVSAGTLDKWCAREGSVDHRVMPLMAVRLILRMLDDRKRELLAAGDREGAEVIDALGAQVDPARRAASMRTFDELQRSAGLFVRFERPRRKPRAFGTLAEKNAWERNQEIRLARRKTARARDR